MTPLDTLVRDLTKVHPRSKSEVRAMVEEYSGELLEDYSNWLHKYGYMDSDYCMEEPKAVDRYLESITHKN